jgi:CRP-like cAMP-binding protein
VRIKPTAETPRSGRPGQDSPYGRLVATHTAEDLILGEMTCMNNYPRAATLVALEDSEVFEIRRNVLYHMQRHPASREILNQTYRQRVLERELRSIPLLSAVSDEVRQQCVDFLAPRVELMHLDPGQIIFRQGEPADHFYMVRLGFVKVSQRFERGEWVLDYLGPRRHFGEMAFDIIRNDRALISTDGDAKNGRDFPRPQLTLRIEIHT